MARLDDLTRYLTAAQQLPHHSSLLDLLRFFRDAFRTAPDAEVAAGFVPGRIELLGKHTDYAGGHSIVCAIDRGFLFVAAANSLRRMRLRQPNRRFPDADFPINDDLAPPRGEWVNYPMTVVRRLARNFGAASLAGVDVAFQSTLPVGSGMSGSSALMIMTFAAVATINRLWLRPELRRSITGPLDLAMYLACLENGRSFGVLSGDAGVGTFGGSEDHTAILNGRADMVSLYQFAPTLHKADLFWPPDLDLHVCFSGVQAEKTGSELEKYNRISSLAGDVVQLMGATGRRPALLRDALAMTGELAPARLATILPEEPLRRRLLQFALEERRFIPRAATALTDRHPEVLGEAINRSHRASREHLANIVPQTEAAAQLAVELGAYGASGFGGGFGGSVYAIASARGDDFLSRWQAAYQLLHPDEATRASFFSSRPASGLMDLATLEGPVRLVDRWFP